ncbi:23S rRNA (pseudouridine(1915)-N(3))-methyltransferase RlmH [Marinibaculum pumilum]|uniref:Ribosomal RNA large subunit methyltransferase H n=1 Tax=Marinibaculum pumilum TaxID=1766165 RepID=A0ABV7L142_9PROT
MRLLIAAIGRARGKSRDGPEARLLAEYLKRLPWQVSLTELPQSRAATADQRKAEEAAALQRAVPAGHRRIVLDERGEDLGSAAIAAWLDRQRQDGGAAVAVLIGGPDGLEPGLAARADLRLAFGRQTWPHMLVRAMLAEQLYRAYTILENHPYHRA